MEDNARLEEIGREVLNAAFSLHTRFGSGLLEKAYRILLASKLIRLGHKVEEEKSCSIDYNGVINFGMPSLKDGIIRVVNSL